MIHTIVPIDVVFGQPFPSPNPRFEIPLGNGSLLEVERLDAVRVRVVRLISPDPYAYLNPNCQPGAELGLRLPF
ncbi:MAG: hypothetical protein BLM47_06275 [Candidatus Reconcilbacillus cellulovorans]|uniref:Uncharacterized protein n=1 Tax=Candidatus Reconcilbacillus cellulovorans TaxID=1906605 RepID=A0A2A6E0R8_9BACL|nr:MAG: hypothetical protein BLM47_06275 [Candidatus Reconcilbacillus cellulovorans]